MGYVTLTGGGGGGDTLSPLAYPSFGRLSYLFFAFLYI